MASKPPLDMLAELARANRMTLRKAQQRDRRIQRAIEALAALQLEEWDAVMSRFCRSCGTQDPSCQCGNDE